MSGIIDNNKKDKTAYNGITYICNGIPYTYDGAGFFEGDRYPVLTTLAVATSQLKPVYNGPDITKGETWTSRAAIGSLAVTPGGKLVSEAMREQNTPKPNEIPYRSGVTPSQKAEGEGIVEKKDEKALPQFAGHFANTDLASRQARKDWVADAQHAAYLKAKGWTDQDFTTFNSGVLNGKLNLSLKDLYGGYNAWKTEQDRAAELERAAQEAATLAARLKELQRAADEAARIALEKAAKNKTYSLNGTTYNDASAYNAAVKLYNHDLNFNRWQTARDNSYTVQDAATKMRFDKTAARLHTDKALEQVLWQNLMNPEEALDINVWLKNNGYKGADYLRAKRIMQNYAALGTPKYARPVYVNSAQNGGKINYGKFYN